MSERKIKLFTYLELPGGDRARWTSAERFGPSAYHRVAREAEEALFDGLFRADLAGPSERELRVKGGNFMLDAFQHLASVAAVTRHIGVIGTATSTFALPYTFARQLQSLDHLSGGRVGWNAVTSFFGQQAFGFKELPPQEERYARATEFLEIVHGLWSSWQPGSVDLDPDSGKISSPELIESLNFHGQYFDVEGPLTLPRTPQGWPVQFQAGASGAAKPFAARFAEGIYSASTTLDHARAFYAEMKELVAAAGRNPEHTLIFPGFHPFLASTRSEAEERFYAQYENVDIEEGLKELEFQFGGADLSALDLDKPVPEESLPDTAKLRNRQSRPALYVGIAREPGVTLRRLIQRVGAEGGHYTTFGSYDEVADELELWFTTGAADGFTIGTPNGVSEFAAEVIPRLQAKGLFRDKYEGTTLRESLGLPIPDGALPRWTSPVGALTETSK